MDASPPAPAVAAPTRRSLLCALPGALTAWTLAGRRATAQPGGGAKSLRIAQWAHYVPAFDEWFDKKFARSWGERHGVTVEVDHLPLGELRPRAAGEVATQQGHDIFGFVDPPAGYEGQVVPLTDVVGECERRFGRLIPLAHKGTFNPRTKQYFALADSWAPSPLHYRTDLWAEAGILPESWDRIRDGARRIRERHAITAGFGLAPEADSNMTLRGILWAFGAAEQDEAGQVTLNSRETVEAVKLMTATYREGMSSDVFLWDASSNNRAFVWGRASIIENAISAIRTMEKQNPALAPKVALAPAAAGPRGRLTAVHVLHSYVVWRFSDKTELAKQFLIDLVAASAAAFRASEFYNLPSFPRAVSDLPKKLAADRQAPSRYALLADAERWSACPGHPGYLTPPIEEAVHRFVIPTMFARAARGDVPPEEAVRQADVEMRRIFSRFR